METICDGLDDDGDGIIDNKLVSRCGYEEGLFSICGACPVAIPSFTAPSPALQPLGIIIVKKKRINLFGHCFYTN